MMISTRPGSPSQGSAQSPSPTFLRSWLTAPHCGLRISRHRKPIISTDSVAGMKMMVRMKPLPLMPDASSRAKSKPQGVLHQHVDREEDHRVAQRVEEPVAPERVGEKFHVVGKTHEAVGRQPRAGVEAQPQRVEERDRHEAQVDQQAGSRKSIQVSRRRFCGSAKCCGQGAAWRCCRGSCGFLEKGDWRRLSVY
jgi:hypothetical protein